MESSGCIDLIAHSKVNRPMGSEWASPNALLPTLVESAKDYGQQMSLKKHGVIIDCKHCKCASTNGYGGFDIIVPISDGETGIVGTAKLHCTVTSERHQVEMTEWQDANRHPIQPSDNLQQRVSATLTFLADHRVCGNHNICPSEVIRIVDE